MRKRDLIEQKHEFSTNLNFTYFINKNDNIGKKNFSIGDTGD